MLKTVGLLLAGGQGTRLSILAHHRAKPAVPFGGIFRIIDFSLSNVMHSGISRVGILTQYLPASLIDHIADGKAWDLYGRRRCAKILPPYQGDKAKDWYRGTADAVWQNMNFVNRYDMDRVVILSGDHIYRMDLEKFVSYHIEKKADLTVATMVVPLSEAFRFGIAVTDSENRITGFQEKPKEPKNNLASMGIYVFERDVLSRELAMRIPEGGFDFGQNVIPHMLGKFRIFAYPFENYWRDVGTIDSFWSTHMDLLDPGHSGLNLSAWRTRTNLESERVSEKPPARIVSGARVVNSLLSPGCEVRGEVVRSILSPGVVVDEGAVVRDSILMHHSIVHADSRIIRAIIDKNCVIGKETTIGGEGAGTPNEEAPHLLRSGLTVLGKNVHVGSCSTIGRNCLIYPEVLMTSSHAHINDGGTVH